MRGLIQALIRVADGLQPIRDVLEMSRRTVKHNFTML